MTTTTSSSSSGGGPLAALRARYPHVQGDVRGAFASLLVGLPYSITAGMLAFAPLGPAYMVSGMLAGVASSAVVGLVAAPVGGTALQINGPRGSVALLMAGLMAAIAVHPALTTDTAPDIPRIVGLTMLCVAISGLLQVAFGLLRFGAVIRYLPYPVISGFMIALGLLVLLPQIPAILGAAPGMAWAALFSDPHLRWGAIAVGLATILCMTQLRMRYPRIPSPLIGVLAGTALHYLLVIGFGRDAVGMAGVDTLATGSLPPQPWRLPQFTIDRVAADVIVSVLPAIVTLAFVGALESLLSSSVLSIASQMRYRSNRELVAQGLSNVAAAAAGGVVSCGAPFRGVTNFAAGGRTRLSGALHSLMAVPLLLFAVPALLTIPIAVLAGVLIVAGWDVVAAWRNRLMACPNEDILIGLIVMIATLSLGTVPAMLFGIVGAMVLYVRNTSRAPLRGHYDGGLRRSTRIRPDEQAAHLRNLGSAIRVIDAQGSLFFGNADRFGLDVEAMAAGCRHLILDLRRVGEVDPTGALVLMQTMRRLGERGIRGSFASVSIGGRRGRVMTRAGLDRVVPPERWFQDADHALEHAEDLELKTRWPDLQAAAEMPVSALDICAGMSTAEVERLKACMVRIDLPAKTALFHEGELGDRLYLLARGEVEVSIRLDAKDARRRRLGTYCPGVTLGEMAAIEGKRRSADALAVSDAVLYALDAVILERMRNEDPALHGRFMLNLTCQLIERLRSTTLELRAAYS